MWDWQMPAGPVERWGGSIPASAGVTLFFLAMLGSLAVAYCFYRDYSDATPITRGYFLTLMWKRIAMGVICGSHVVMYADPAFGVLMLLAGGVAYVVCTGVFLALWSHKGTIIKRDETIGSVVRDEARAVGYDFDTMDRTESISVLKRGLATVAAKIAAEQSGTSDIHA